MKAHEKPKVPIDELRDILRRKLGSEVTEITPLDGGNLSSVFSFVADGSSYVVKFSDLVGAFETERFVAELLEKQEGIRFPRCVALERMDKLTYIIQEKLEGRTLSTLSVKNQLQLIPDLIEILIKLGEVDVTSTRYYGWIKSDGEGSFPTWQEFIAANFDEDQTGTFWENWYELFRTTCLERDVFDEIYQRLLTYIPYNEPHRSFLHGDFHQWNILSDGSQITGIIDGNYMYGDPLIDLAILDRHMPWAGIVQKYRDSLAKSEITIPNFRERLLGAHYYKGLDGLRFYAKMGWSDAYQGTRRFLLELE